MLHVVSFGYLPKTNPKSGQIQVKMAENSHKIARKIVFVLPKQNDSFQSQHTAIGAIHDNFHFF